MFQCFFIYQNYTKGYGYTALVDISERAFGYCINQQVILNIANESNVILFICRMGSENVAAAMLFIGNDVVGIHQMGMEGSVI